MRRAIAVGVCAFSLVGLSAGAASAGETTGSGKAVARSPQASVCSFSGLNDDPGEDAPFGGKTQTYGQLVNQGFAGVFGTPSESCKAKLKDIPPH